MSGPETRGTDGTFQAKYEPEDFLEAVRETDPATTSAVAEYVTANRLEGDETCPHRTALFHLNELEDAGRVDSQKIGRAKVWSISE